MANKKSPSPPERTSSWDLEAFEEQVSGDFNWNTYSNSKKKKQKKVRRVQDLSLSNLGTPPTSPVAPKEQEDSNSTWPFESSPCRMFGGKNTRHSEEADSKNEQLFHTQFADRASNFVSDTEDVINPKQSTKEELDEETSIEDDDESDVFKDSDDDSESEDERDNTNDDKEDGEFPQRQRTSVSTKHKNEDTELHVKKKGTDGEKSVPAGKRKSKKDSSSKAGSKLERKSGLKKQDKQALPSEEKKGKSSEKSVTRSSLSKKTGEKTTRSSKSDDDARPATTAAPRVSRRGITRAKSTDGMGGMGGVGTSERTWARKGSKRRDADELSIVSAHTSASMTRRNRGLRRENSSRTNAAAGNRNALDRRGKLSRAMSNSNVKRPEEYAGNQAPTTMKRSSSHRNLGTGHDNSLLNSSGPLVSVTRAGESTNSLDSAAESHGIAEKRRSSTRAAAENQSQDLPEKRRASRASSSASVSSRERERQNQQQQQQQQQRSQAKASQEKAATQDAEPDTALSASADAVSASDDAPYKSSPVRRKKSHRMSPGGGSRSVKSEAKSSSSKRTSRSADRRDLLELLKEGKQVQPVDLMDKDNRKLLHFLMYEHKMGISQQALYREIRQEKESS